MLKQRVITALVLLAALVLILFYLPENYVITAFAVIAAVAGWEWSRLSSASPFGRIWFPLWILTCCIVCLLYPDLQQLVCALAAVFWLLVPLWLIRRWKLSNQFATTLVGTVVLVPAWIGMVRLHSLGPWVLLAAMALVWVADIAAYFAGRAFGRHKLAPTVSPGKTWEGAGGALAGALLYVFILRYFLKNAFPENILMIVLSTALLVAISIVGDLFESLIKRQANVKDSSGLLPGHGGVLDRIDSLTAALPMLVVFSGFLHP